MKREFLGQIFDKSPSVKFRENSFGGSRVVPCGRTGTDMTKLIVAFCNCADEPEK